MHQGIYLRDRLVPVFNTHAQENMAENKVREKSMKSSQQDSTEI
jgi:hypothetical protein